MQRKDDDPAVINSSVSSAVSNNTKKIENVLITKTQSKSSDGDESKHLDLSETVAQNKTS